MSSRPSADSVYAMPGFSPGATKYEILGVPRDATADELKLAYRRLALLYHPDRHSEQDREQAGEIFKLITSAYRTLSDERERRRYNQAIDRGEEFRETSGGETAGVSLADILADIGQFEHIFTEDKLLQFDATLRDMVVLRLIDELNEHIVAVYPMLAAPEGAQFRGKYRKGAVVLTTVRVLLPFTYTWQESHGNTRVTYTGSTMSGVVLPSVQRIAIKSTDRLRNKLEVEIEVPNGRTRFRPGRIHLGKLLLLARLWGIPVETTECNSPGHELRWALLEPAAWVAGLSAAVLAAASIGGIFEGGFIDNPVRLAAFFARTGVWQCVVLLYGLLAGRRLIQHAQAYRSAEPVSAVRSCSKQPRPGEMGLGVAAPGA